MPDQPETTMCLGELLPVSLAEVPSLRPGALARSAFRQKGELLLRFSSNYEVHHVDQNRSGST